jgi:hypothetical protein
MEHRGELSGTPLSDSPADDRWTSSDTAPTMYEAKDTPTVIEAGDSQRSARPSLTREVVRGLDFFVFVTVVAGLSLISFSWLSATFGNDETRDRWFYLSIPLMAECAYWCSRLVSRAACQKQSSCGSSFFGRSGADSWLYLIPAGVGALSFFVVASASYALLAGVLVLLGYQCLRERVRALRWLEIVEVPVSAYLIYQGLLWMALLPLKEPHHWSYYLGPVQSVFQGGHLLWDVPSQYGFLNIWVIANLAKLTGAGPIASMWMVVEGLQCVALALALCIFRFRLGFSTIVSSIFAVSLTLCIPGFEHYDGPVSAPSISAIRFLPSLLTLILIDMASRNPSGWRNFWAALLMAGSCLWSAESCIYTVVPAGFFALLSFARAPSLAFFKSPVLKISAMAMVLASVFVGVYALSLPHGIDPQSFVEYAQAYGSYKGVLPIDAKVWTWTWLFVFVLSTGYFIARSQFASGGVSASQGGMLFAFIMCIGTYFIARSHYRNVQNLIPWFLIAIGAMLTAQASPERKAQRSMICMIASVALVGFVCLYGPDNRSKIAMRGMHKSLYVPPVYSMIPSDVAAAARAAVQSSLFSFIHFDSMYAYSPEIDSYGNALPISPLMHFVTPPDQRVRMYTQRMLERVPESYVLCEERVCGGVPYVFREMGSFIEVTQVPFSFSKTWQIYRLRRKENP